MWSQDENQAPFPGCSKETQRKISKVSQDIPTPKVTQDAWVTVMDEEELLPRLIPELRNLRLPRCANSVLSAKKTQNGRMGECCVAKAASVCLCVSISHLKTQRGEDTRYSHAVSRVELWLSGHSDHPSYASTLYARALITTPGQSQPL